MFHCCSNHSDWLHLLAVSTRKPMGATAAYCDCWFSLSKYHCCIDQWINELVTYHELVMKLWLVDNVKLFCTEHFDQCYVSNHKPPFASRITVLQVVASCSLAMAEQTACSSKLISERRNFTIILSLKFVYIRTRAGQHQMHCLVQWIIIQHCIFDYANNYDTYTKSTLCWVMPLMSALVDIKTKWTVWMINFLTSMSQRPNSKHILDT